MQPLNDAQLAEHTAILGKVKLDKGLDYETIGKMLIASVLRRNEKSIDAQKPDVQGRVSIASRSGTDQVPHRRPGSESGLLRL